MKKASPALCARLYMCICCLVAFVIWALNQTNQYVVYPIVMVVGLGFLMMSGKMLLAKRRQQLQLSTKMEFAYFLLLCFGVVCVAFSAIVLIGTVTNR